MTIATTTAAVMATQEYQDDVALLTRVIVKNYANDLVLDGTGPFEFVMAHLLAYQRYFIRHSPEQQDIDQTLFLDQIKDQVGYGLPSLGALPILELIRENKNFNGNKGTEVLFKFAGAIVGSPISLDYPENLMLVLDDDSTYLDGALDVGVNLPYSQSKMNRIRDGIIWSRYTYIVNVEQAQNVKDYGDLQTMLDIIHPAGTKRFTTLSFNWMGSLESQGFLPTAGLRNFNVSRFREYAGSVPTLDNGYILDGDNFLDMYYGDFSLTDLYVEQIPPMRMDFRPLTLPEDILTHAYFPGNPNQAFSRFTTNPDGTYTEVFSDNDSFVLENVSTNVGLKNYTLGNLKNLTLRHLKDAAYNLDKQNQYHQPLYNEGLHIQVKTI